MFSKVELTKHADTYFFNTPIIAIPFGHRNISIYPIYLGVILQLLRFDHIWSNQHSPGFSIGNRWNKKINLKLCLLDKLPTKSAY